ncbi:MAG: hypothetical protein U1F77_19385 [Kiritimatiellia bacterium]
MKVNGEAVYGCGPTPYKGPELGAEHPTEKDPRPASRCGSPGLWLHHQTRPPLPHRLPMADTGLVLEGVKDRAVKASLLADPARAALTLSGKPIITIGLPAAARMFDGVRWCVELE